MTHIDRTDAVFEAPRALRNSFSKMFETPFDRRSRDLAARVAELRSKSDTELAGMGLERGEILHHVFGARRRS